MCRPRGEVAHIRLEILDNSRLVGGRDVGTGVVKGERTDGGVVCLEDGFKIERQPVPGRDSPLVEPVSIRRPSGVHWERHQAGKRLTIHEQNARTVTAFTGHRILFVDVWMNFVQRDVEALSG